LFIVQLITADQPEILKQRQTDNGHDQKSEYGHLTAIGGLCGFLLVWGMNYQGDVRNAFILFLLL